MSVASHVGHQDLPLAAGALATPSNDPVVDLVLAYCAHWLKAMLDARLAVQTPTSADACPTANRWPWDPRDVWTRQAKPGLYVWQRGASRVSPETLLWDRRERTLGLFYVFEEAQLPDGYTSRAGLMATADAVLARAFDRMSHPTFAHGSAPAGTSIRLMLGQSEDLALRYDGGEVGFMAEIPGGGERQGMTADGRVQRGFPCLRATLTVWERIGVDTSTYEDDANGDATVTISTNTEAVDPTDTTQVLERYLPAFDGEP